MSILYATFDDAGEAEKAGGALLDHGLARRDLSIISKYGVRSRADGPKHRNAVSSREVRGLSACRVEAAARKKRISERDYARADDSYREADNAERLAKTGITITTPRDAGAGALKGTIVGLCLAVLGGLVSIWPSLAGSIKSSSGLLPAIGIVSLAMVSGAIVGAVIGFLKDQGTSDDTAGRSYPTIPGRPVLLAADVSSGALLETDARRLISKYHASSIDIS